MKRVFIIHGYQGSPNGGWRPWLMAELEKLDVYACALAMPNPDSPVCTEWVAEITSNVQKFKKDGVYLVGHSLGVPAILRYLEKNNCSIVTGAVLVSGPAKSVGVPEIEDFLADEFDFNNIRISCNNFAVIQGDNDPLVPFFHAEILTSKLSADLTMVENGGHLNGSAGWNSLPQCLTALKVMFDKDI